MQLEFNNTKSGIQSSNRAERICAKEAQVAKQQVEFISTWSVIFLTNRLDIVSDSMSNPTQLRYRGIARTPYPIPSIRRAGASFGDEVHSRSCIESCL